MSQKTREDILAELEAEEILAQLHEGAAPISDEALELVLRYRELAKQKKVIQVEQDSCKDLVLEEMTEKGVNKLTRNGVVEVEDVHVVRTEIDIKGILSEFPGAAKYITKKASTRFDAKK